MYVKEREVFWGLRRAAQQRCIAMLRSARPPNSHAHHGGITGTCFTERGGQAYSHSQRHLETYVLVIYLSFIRYTDVLFDTLFSHDHVWCRIENSAEEHLTLLQDEIVSTVNDSDCQYYITNAI